MVTNAIRLPALVLAAGFGTRLLPLTRVRAKPAIPVAGDPLIRRIVAHLVEQGCADVVVNLHYRPETITAVLGDGSDLGARVRYSWEQPLLLGSAGGPRQALDILGAATFAIVNGDTLTDVSLGAMAADHRATGALVTMALIPNKEPLRYNGVRLDTAGRVTGFVPRGPSAEGSFHLVGVQVADSEVFHGLPAGQPVETIRGIYDQLIALRPGSIRGFVCNAAFWDVGTVADYFATSRAFANQPRRPGGGGADVAVTARIVDSILWDDVRVGADAVIEHSIVTDGVRVPAGARYIDAVVTADLHGEPLVEPLPI